MTHLSELCAAVDDARRLLEGIRDASLDRARSAMLNVRSYAGEAGAPLLERSAARALRAIQRARAGRSHRVVSRVRMVGLRLGEL